ncbi:hypothetical protein I6A60_26485 [Frankia sp. AgB1.9]|uniref:hypothetical protein n=1 Tax=unclassified Frankia TaxID=2632575 RepID=UPI00193473A8|nr:MULTISPECIES: hypothetical protein [unclassified Frankia]MBL7494366.1 hypothetical protein [Frankia sp. AgW1.1]MBL7551386.1 hypothetical protein [Frankia sp. AgB1.9]MBL7620721.1 hypothetical protein [Frankia sp. AgB1.8]
MPRAILTPDVVTEAEQHITWLLADLEMVPYQRTASMAGRIATLATHGLGSSRETEAPLHRLAGKAVLVQADALREIGKPKIAADLVGQARIHAAHSGDPQILAAAAHVGTALAFYEGRPQRAAHDAAEASEWVTGTQMAVRLHLERARALGMLRDAPGTRAAVTAAWSGWDALPYEQQSDQPAQWFDSISAAELLYFSTVALALAGSNVLAEETAAEAINVLRRSRMRGYEGCVCLALATMWAYSGLLDLDHAVSLAHEGLDLFGDRREVSTDSAAQRFIVAAKPHIGADGVSDVLDRIVEWRQLPLH